jgi:hypothetical protein
MLRGMDNSIIFQNGHNKARFPGRLAKSIVEEKEGEKVAGDQDKQDNALKHHRFLFSATILGVVVLKQELAVAVFDDGPEAGLGVVSHGER